MIVTAARRRNEFSSRLWNDFARLWSLLGLRLIPLGVGHGHWGNHRHGPFSFKKPADALNAYRVCRQDLGRAILLGLEFIVAGDIIRTVVVHPTLDNLIVLAIIVVIRTFLSITLQLEVEGHWPWQHPNISETKVEQMTAEKEGHGRM